MNWVEERKQEKGKKIQTILDKPASREAILRLDKGLEDWRREVQEIEDRSLWSKG